MDSGPIVLFRALIMLSCLILVPMAAIFGSAFPSLIQCCLPDSWQSAIKTNTTSTAAQSTAPATGFGPSASSTGASSAPEWTSQVASSVSSSQSTEPADAFASTPAWPEASNLSAGHNAAPAHGGPRAPLADAPAFGDQPTGPRGTAARENVPAVFSAPAETTLPSQSAQPTHSAQPSQPNHVAVASRTVSAAPSRGTDIAAAPGWPATPSTGEDASDRFTTIEQRLRSYGAVHYRLETSGQRGELYRFQCTMPGSVSGKNIAFEAVDPSAIEAMQRVLSQVDTWRTTARPAP